MKKKRENEPHGLRSVKDIITYLYPEIIDKLKDKNKNSK